MKKLLLAGPWVGEFGWELLCWQGLVRNMSRKYDGTIVACRYSSRALYEDFADEFIDVETNSMETDGPKCHGEDIGILSKLGNVTCNKWMFPEKLKWRMESGGVPVVDNQEFIVYGEEFEKNNKYVVIHARSTDKVGQGERNWSDNNWAQLVMSRPEYEFISIGTRDASYHIQGTIDCRGSYLKEVFEILRHTRYIIGPSSGPMHLASLCGTNQLVWSGHERNYDRYTKLWNPHNTDVVYLDTWQPTVAQVLEAMRTADKL